MMCLSRQTRFGRSCLALLLSCALGSTAASAAEPAPAPRNEQGRVLISICTAGGMGVAAIIER